MKQYFLLYHQYSIIGIQQQLKNYYFKLKYIYIKYIIDLFGGF